MKAANRLGIEVGQVLFHPKTAGYVYVECAGPNELEKLLSLVPSSKGIVGEVPPGDVKNLFDVAAPDSPLKEYESVVVSQGPEKGSEGIIERIDGKDAVVLLDDPIMPRRMSAPLSWLRRQGE